VANRTPFLLGQQCGGRLYMYWRACRAVKTFAVDCGHHIYHTGSKPAFNTKKSIMSNQNKLQAYEHGTTLLRHDRIFVAKYFCSFVADTNFDHRRARRRVAGPKESARRLSRPWVKMYTGKPPTGNIVWPWP
jgi:hypothetical protein